MLSCWLRKTDQRHSCRLGYTYLGNHTLEKDLVIVNGLQIEYEPTIWCRGKGGKWRFRLHQQRYLCLAWRKYSWKGYNSSLKIPERMSHRKWQGSILFHSISFKIWGNGFRLQEGSFQLNFGQGWRTLPNNEISSGKETFILHLSEMLQIYLLHSETAQF